MNFAETFHVRKLESWAITWRCLRDLTFSRVSRIPTCDRQIDDYSIHDASMVSRGKDCEQLSRASDPRSVCQIFVSFHRSHHPSPRQYFIIGFKITLLWPAYGIGQAIIFLPCGFFFLSVYLLFSSPNLSRRRLYVCHTSTHGVALVRI